MSKFQGCHPKPEELANNKTEIKTEVFVHYCKALKRAMCYIVVVFSSRHIHKKERASLIPNNLTENDGVTKTQFQYHFFPHAKMRSSISFKTPLQQRKKLPCYKK